MGRVYSRHGSDKNILVTKPEEKRPVGRGGHRWENSSNMGLKEIG
jgi:hypothetical protein